MSDKKIRTGIVGLGKMGLVHAAAIRTHPQVDWVAACDNSKFMNNALGKFIQGVEFYDDHQKMLKEQDLDCVFITTPTGSHASITKDCVEAGKHVFVEKPLATNLAEAQEVAAMVSKRGLKSQVGYVCRYAPTFEKAKQILDSGVLGPIQNFGSVKYSSDVLRKVEKSWRFMRKAAKGGGGVVNEFACHGVDLLVWLLGEPNSVDARMESWYSAEVEDHVHATMDYGDFSGWLDSSWSMQDYRKPY
ncbi:MAG: Gfo/Idh/MocA family oxidoreductase, partial [Candidatus Eisenbacteria bacterium]|nr:Gfo/Idh/MocA family oxidoreductase [Candidatus Eisenbacteria bacterium]